MNENQFVVDLGTLKLTAEQRQTMNAAIQRAVTSELASINLGNKVALFPISKFPRGPIINGIIARDLGNRFNEFIK
jgi:hypothetical protein